MDKECELVKDIRTLDSEMQQLVYENYNKFINATDTIKKMKSDFQVLDRNELCMIDPYFWNWVLQGSIIIVLWLDKAGFVSARRHFLTLLGHTRKWLR